MSIAQALFVPGAMAFLVGLLVLGSWLEVRLVKAEQQLELVPLETGNDAAALAPRAADGSRSAA